MPVPTDETNILVMYVISHVSCNGHSCCCTLLVTKIISKKQVLPMQGVRMRAVLFHPATLLEPALASGIHTPETGISQHCRDFMELTLALR